MGNIGRFVCVSVPFILTLGSLIALLVAALSGVTNKSLYMFRVDLSELSVDPKDVTSLLERRDILDDIGNFVSGTDGAADIIDNVVGGDSAESNGGNNITFSTLGLNEIYEVSVWGFCSEKSDGSDRECTKPRMDWASDELNTTFIDRISEAFGSDYRIPEEIVSALDVFKRVSRWTQIVFIIALAALAAQIFVGLFSVCTRIASCVCFLIAGLSIASTIAAASLSTATSAVIVGAMEGSATIYGAQGSINTSFLALVWVSVAFAIGAGVAWLVTACCCAPDRSSRRSKKHGDNEKGFRKSTSYQPLEDPFGQGQGQDQAYGQAYGHGANNAYNGAQASYGAPQYPTSNPRSDLAYEPYTHRQ